MNRLLFMDILVLGFFNLAEMHLYRLKSFTRSENILQAEFYVMLIAPLYFCAVKLGNMRLLMTHPVPTL